MTKSTQQRIDEIIKKFTSTDFSSKLLKLHLESLVLQAKVERCELQLEQLKK